MAKRRKKKQQKRKYSVIVLVTLLLIVLTVGIALAGILFVNQKSFGDLIRGDAIISELIHGKSKDRRDSSNSGSASTSESENSTQEESDSNSSSEEEIPEEELLVLTDAQIYRGDLILVNADHAYSFLNNEDMDIVRINDAKVFLCAMADDDFELSYHILAPLGEMINDCNTALSVSDTGISSAYRSYEYQQQVYEEIAEERGKAYADQYVATPGFSEHHTGLALDMGCYTFAGYVGTFSESRNAVWINEHCQQYGFVRRYKEDKVSITGISNESWHFRYVGVPHATYMNENNLCLEEYIDFLRTKTREDPLVVTCLDGRYQIWFTTEQQIREPKNDYTISGNNVDGYIITEILLN